MPTPHDQSQRKSENQSTYIIYNKNHKDELVRLNHQDQIVTTGMGGVLAEQTDVNTFQL